MQVPFLGRAPRTKETLPDFWGVTGVNPEIHGPQNKEEKNQNQVLINKIGGCPMV